MCMTLLWVIPKTVSPPALPGKRFLQIGSAPSAAWARICSRRSNPEHPDTNDKRRSRKWFPLFLRPPRAVQLNVQRACFCVCVILEMCNFKMCNFIIKCLRHSISS